MNIDDTMLKLREEIALGEAMLELELTPQAKELIKQIRSMKYTLRYLARMTRQEPAKEPLADKVIQEALPIMEEPAKEIIKEALLEKPKQYGPNEIVLNLLSPHIPPMPKVKLDGKNGHRKRVLEFLWKVYHAAPEPLDWQTITRVCNAGGLKISYPTLTTYYKRLGIKSVGRGNATNIYKRYSTKKFILEGLDGRPV